METGAYQLANLRSSHESNMNTPSNSVASIADQTHTANLASLLALAAGAVTLPQTGQADIIYTDLNSSPVVVGYGGAGSNEFLFDVPGTANIGFVRESRVTYTQPGSNTINYRSVKAGDLSGGALGGIRGNAPGFASPQLFGATWNQGDGSFGNVAVGTANDGGLQTPLNGYANRYLAWVFSDSTQGNALRYGWVEISLSMAGYNAGGPNVTILGYAYDNTGLKPTMGQSAVPEPSSAAFMVLGALMLGARGLRKWRQNHQPTGQS